MAANSVTPDGGKVKLLRQQRGWTQDQLSDEAGITVKTVSNIERHCDTLVTTLRMVANALGVDVAQLMPSSADIERPAVDPQRVSSPSPVSQAARNSFIADRTRDFVGRQYVFDRIDQFQNNPQIAAGYFLIEGDPGAGKSSILAQYVKTTGCVSHFNMQSAGITAADEFARSLAIQLEDRFGVHTSLTRDGNTDGRLLADLLEDASAGLDDGQRLPIAIDALDEVDLKAQAASSNVLYLPEVLPDRLFLLLSARRKDNIPLVTQAPFRRLDLSSYHTETRRDVEQYITFRAQTPAIRTWLKQQRTSPKAFVAGLAEKSEHNFMYLRYVLDAIGEGQYPALSLDQLPVGLEAYYEDHWRRMGMMSSPLPVARIRIIYILCEAGAPLSAPLIAQFTDTDLLLVQETLLAWRQFLHRTVTGEETRYGLYHTSFGDFLRRKDIVSAAGVTLEAINASLADTLWKDLVRDD